MSTKVKVLTILGTRPEFIKLAPVILELNRRADRFESRVCSTGQHRQMLDQMMPLFNIQADVDLNVMTSGQTLSGLTALMIERLDEVIKQEKPDITLVQGDTTTAFCGALVSFYNQVRVGHVEAGLRTYQKYSPFPEEINRRLVTPIADLHFPPTQAAYENLCKEGVDPSSVFVTGNTVIDALLWVREKVKLNIPELPADIETIVTENAFVLITGHRRESFGDGFESICRAIRDVTDQFPRIHFIYPVHLNPQVREPVNRILGEHPRIHLVEPLSYAPFIWVMDHALLVLTDSGGVQEEAPSLGKPVLVMRETTERPEGIKAGNARLVGVNRERIVSELSNLIAHPQERDQMTHMQNPYGDGQAAVRIVDILSRQMDHAQK